ncbi:MAG: hypothetical protein WA476_16405 [Acidobacteriaceae bacterium]
MNMRLYALSAGAGPLALLGALLAAAGCSANPPGKLPPAPMTSGAAPHTTTYATNFPLQEDPISEGGRWIGGKSAGIDWGNVSTMHGLAIGRAGPKEYADSVALLAGNWGPDQTVEAVVDRGYIFRAPEVSLRLRSSLSAHRCTGYEVSNSLRADGTAYLIIVRWNGPLADFTYLLNVAGKQYGVATGDVVKATIVGDTITAYKNGVQMGQAKDDTFRTGQPGFGFNEGKNGDYGITRVTVTAKDSGP